MAASTCGSAFSTCALEKRNTAHFPQQRGMPGIVVLLVDQGVATAIHFHHQLRRLSHTVR
jgi:hypothetical protein